MAATRHDGETLLAAWSKPEFAEAIDALARISGSSRSVLIRAALAQLALEADEGEAHTLTSPKGVT